MPNWVRNEFTVTGDKKDIQKFLRHIKSSENAFDFNKIIPMPKSLDTPYGSDNDEDIYWYLSNKGTLSVDEVKKNPLSKLMRNRFFADHIGDVAKRIAKRVKAPSYETGKQLCQNYTLYGATTWYDWCINNWSTKWNSCEPYVSVGNKGDIVNISFDTAWSMPEKVFAKLCEDSPSLEFEGKFADEDLGHNCGTWWSNTNDKECEIFYGGDFEFACDVWGYDPSEFDEYR